MNISSEQIIRNRFSLRYTIIGSVATEYLELKGNYKAQERGGLTHQFLVFELPGHFVTDS